MTNYYRIAGYCPEQDFCFIMDCNGCFEKLWQFSSFLIQKGLKVLEVSSSEKFLDGNISKAAVNTDKLLLRANADGEPQYITHEIDGVTYKAVKVGEMIYVPDRARVT